MFRHLCRGGLPLAVLGGLAGCPGSFPSDLYDASRASIFLGSKQRFDGEMDPLRASDQALVGTSDQGGEWNLEIVGGGLLVGMPDAASVKWYSSATLSEESPSPDVDINDSETASGFGTSIAAAPSASGKGFDILVGAPQAAGADDALESGRLYVFRNQILESGRSLDAAEADLTIVGSRAFDHLGVEVTSCADLDGDGIPDWAASSPWGQYTSSSGETSPDLAGLVWLIRSSVLIQGDTADSLAPILSFAPELYSEARGAQAGAALDCRGHFNGDTIPELAIGAPYADKEGSEDAIGAVFILDPTSNLNSQVLESVHLWERWGTDVGDQLGGSLASADLDGDGLSDLLAGSPGSGQGRGSLIMYLNSVMPTPIEGGHIFLGEAVADRFGSSVNLADLDHDGHLDMLVGAPGRNPTGLDQDWGAGSLYLWYGLESPLSWSHSQADAVFVRNQGQLHTGAIVTTGDLNGDGFDDLVIAQGRASGRD